MKGPLAEMFAVNHELDGLHLAIELSRNSPFTPAWGPGTGYRPNRWRIGRLYFRPRHFSLGDRGKVLRHARR